MRMEQPSIRTGFDLYISSSFYLLFEFIQRIENTRWTLCLFMEINDKNKKKKDEISRNCLT